MSVTSGNGFMKKLASMDAINTIERIILISWLLKDFGWMTLNIYLGFPFGVISILCHSLLVLVDTRSGFIYYNSSLVFWVTANFIWMTIEFCSETPSSAIHFAPNVPLGGLSDYTIDVLVIIKTIMFLIGYAIQIAMYVLIYLEYIPIPEEHSEDEDALKELELFCLTDKSKDSSTTPNNQESLLTSQTNRITVGFVENSYIVFWVSKDIFWSWGTGEFLYDGDNLTLNETMEAFALLNGTCAVLLYYLVAYLYRKNLLKLLDSFTFICWISANYCWMSGEFFIRYDSGRNDDTNEGDDLNTRVAALVFFGAGISIQVFNLVYFNKQLFKQVENLTKYEDKDDVKNPIV